MIVVIQNYRYTAVKTWLFRCQIKRGNVFHTWPHHHHIPFPATIMYNRYIINRRRVLCHHGKTSNDVKNREKKQFSEKVRQTGMWLWGMKDNKLNPTLRKDIQWNTMKAKKKKGLGRERWANDWIRWNNTWTYFRLSCSNQSVFTHTLSS